MAGLCLRCAILDACRDLALRISQNGTRNRLLRRPLIFPVFPTLPPSRRHCRVSGLQKARGEARRPTFYSGPATTNCFNRRADGKWGSGSERALKDYAGRQGIELASLQTTADILGRLKATKARVCPLICGKGLEEKNGRCEKVKREARVEPDVRRSSSEKMADETQQTGQNSAKIIGSNNKRTCYTCKRFSTIERVCMTALEWQNNPYGQSYCKK